MLRLAKQKVGTTKAQKSEQKGVKSQERELRIEINKEEQWFVEDIKKLEQLSKKQIQEEEIKNKSSAEEGFYLVKKPHSESKNDLSLMSDFGSCEINRPTERKNSTFVSRNISQDWEVVDQKKLSSKENSSTNFMNLESTTHSYQVTDRRASNKNEELVRK